MDRKQFELHKKHPETDLVLMDIKMPVMDGYSASMKIKEMNNDALIIAQTAYALAGNKEKALAAGCRDYLTKPLKNRIWKGFCKNILVEIRQS